MIQPFNYYLKGGAVRKSLFDPIIAKELFRKGEVRLLRLLKNPPTEEESSIFFEDVYESIRESAQSLMELGGFKPYSHEALIAYLEEKKMLSPEELNIFNNYRILRNNSVYKAENVSIDKCKESLLFAQKILPNIKEKLSLLLTEGKHEKV
ncbi:hypothetical protein HY483_03720 [Candidatus Woesearchaeota archaeon]|nr:hypothetical protein [Candidatus Woesearchaeota archaeon]